MSSAEVTDAHMLAAALQGESSFWFAVPRSGKPLPESWSSASCYWVYPVEHDLVRFAKVNGFNPTDSVYELDPSGVSKVFPSATLKANVQAKRCRLDGVTYFFVPAEEVDWVEREYRAMLKKEAERQGTEEESAASTMTRRVPARRNAALNAVQKAEDKDGEDEGGREETKAVSDAKGAEVHGDDGKGDAAEEADEDQENESSSSSGDESSDEDASQQRRRRVRSSRRGGGQHSLGSHKRREPHRGTTVYIAPIRPHAVGQHRSNEAFSWPAHFIVHRGSVDFLCPAQTGNNYGFRLDKVTHNGFPVFLLFGSAVNNADAVDPSAHGVPAMETAVVRGEGGDKGVGNTVMILTRPPSAKHGYRNGEQPVARTATSGASSTNRRRHRRRDDSDEDDTPEDSTSSEEEEDPEDADWDDSEDGNGRRRQGGRKAAKSSAKGVSGASSAGGRHAAKAARGEASAGRSKNKHKKEKLPLQVASVNTWTDPADSPVSVDQLAQQYPFACDSTTPLRTTVFPDGTCVSYSTASAEKVQAAVEKKKGGSSKGPVGGSGTSSSNAPRIGGNTPDDDAIRSLLENVQLAQLQNQSASAAP